MTYNLHGNGNARSAQSDDAFENADVQNIGLERIAGLPPNLCSRRQPLLHPKLLRQLLLHPF